MEFGESSLWLIIWRNFELMPLSYQQTPIQEIKDPLLDRAGVSLHIKREDLNHPYVSGNKWWKLKFNLEEAAKNNCNTLLTFGGAFSNHIIATAAAADELGFKSIGIIRGEPTSPLNPVLLFAQQKGMELRFISREAYRTKDIAESWRKDTYVIPEGGSNLLAVKGVEEFCGLLPDTFDFLCCPVGTGGTLSGLIEGVSFQKKILGFAVLKHALLEEEIKNLSKKSNAFENWEIINAYHYGGYAKHTPELISFMANFTRAHSVPLDFVYTAKMMAGIFDMVQKGYYQRGTTILALHTGGTAINNHVEKLKIIQP